MLEPLLHILNEKKIVLASGAPNKKQFFDNIGLKVEGCASTFEEDLDPSNFKTFAEFVEETALQKVLEVEERLKRENRAADLVIGADTMVTIDNQMFGKPKDEEDAVKTLKRLSGKSNVVLTGVVVKPRGKDPIKFTQSTEVFFDVMTDAQIRGYVATKEPMRMAGSYAIQGKGGSFVKRIEGDYSNVIGMPVNAVCRVLTQLYGN
ncbi:dTTP/UTP pyrophosphatase-like [Ostrinia nubilalis]|uniref:dTTP/UTP pyrophosphatase-like n=1 Tax=Ostrinia nubilalis TaxID=29057 RepID=UPI00308262C1